MTNNRCKALEHLVINYGMGDLNRFYAFTVFSAVDHDVEMASY